MENKIDTIIFDLGGVLVDWNPVYLYRKVFNGDEEKMNWFLQNVCTMDWNMEQDGGRTIAEGNAIKIAEFPEYEDLINLYYGKWTQMLSGPITENVELFKKLKKSGNYKIYALTNWSNEKWDIAVEIFPFFRDFDGVVVSGKEKIRKPSPEIYNLILNRYQINPEKAIFIDDNIDNIVAAKTFKIQGVHFKSDSSLKKELELLKLTF